MSSLYAFFGVALGGAVGSLLRYFASTLSSDQKILSTFFVNITGAFLAGLLVHMFDCTKISASYKPAIMTGLLGGYTTFSSLTIEVVQLFNNKEYLAAASYIILSNVTGIACAFAGIIIAKLLFN